MANIGISFANRQTCKTLIKTGICLTEVKNRFRGVLVILISLTFADKPVKAEDAVLRLLQERKCPKCELADADLVHAELRNADLRNAKLMRANLSQAKLDGADLREADLSYTSLRGASLRGANLTGSQLYGTDLREADLSGALLSLKALKTANWKGAKGIAKGSRSHAAIHNAGVEAFQTGQWAEAEQLFSDAILHSPTEPLSWVARGISRSEQAKDDLSAADFRFAASLYKKIGINAWSEQLQEAAKAVSRRRFHTQTVNEGQGIGIQLLEGTISGLRMVAPIAAKALIPLGTGF